MCVYGACRGDEELGAVGVGPEEREEERGELAVVMKNWEPLVYVCVWSLPW